MAEVKRKNLTYRDGVWYNKKGKAINSDGALQRWWYDLDEFDKGYNTNVKETGSRGASEADYYNYISEYVDSLGNEWWNSLDDTDKNALLAQYRSDEIKNFSNLWGLQAGKEYTIDTDRLIADLNALSEWSNPDLKRPELSDYKYLVDPTALYADIDAELNPVYDEAFKRLDDEYALNLQSFNDQLKSSEDMYNHNTKSLLSNQYLTSAQTYEAMQSDMRKARQNALEAGASAGIRIAGNINALLSAQNKQSQTAMDTSNALAEMLLQQRNAAAGIRSDYRQYASDWNTQKTNLETQQRTEREDLFNQRYNQQQNQYNNALSDYNNKSYDWENSYNSATSTNPLASSYLNYLKTKKS